jgi:hypothetical protein
MFRKVSMNSGDGLRNVSPAPYAFLTFPSLALLI